MKINLKIKIKKIVIQAVLKLTVIFPSQPPACSDDRYRAPHSVFLLFWWSQGLNPEPYTC